ncbi:WXG100 family type VII secretion target [Tumebacillus flagellatus]|uniref:WXG100 family type VII secretion target n=1 Tax=Tumebacillus flagellatus TaxID=1157490 RepID=A0A074LKF9_9BACL|nr:WXG100 family type VII secretion target [Tumebacillus flagellatus]KEO81579.1 hypothetical protein EL26_20050 [Tumebacillus flagellatus]
MLQADPYSLRYAAARFRGGAEEMRRYASRVTGYQSQVVGSAWTGDAAQTFAGRSEQQVGYLKQQVDVLDSVAVVLVSLADKLS